MGHGSNTLRSALLIQYTHIMCNTDIASCIAYIVLFVLRLICTDELVHLSALDVAALKPHQNELEASSINNHLCSFVYGKSMAPL